MIPALEFYWEQMDGPQVKALFQCLYDYLYNQFDGILSYLRNLTIDTANIDHLETIGALIGVGRPVVEKRNAREIVFSALTPEGGPDHPATYGFEGELLGQRVGGVFSGEDAIQSQFQSMTPYLYKVLLKSILDSNGKFGSLVLLDDIINALYEADKAQEQGPEYTFEIKTETEVQNELAKGDVLIRMGTQLLWKNPFDIEAALEAVANLLYTSSPKLLIQLV